VVNITIKPTIGIVRLESETDAAIKTTSESMLIEGGAPRFLAERINHQTAITGKRLIMPFNNIKFRVWAVSYIVLAKAKRPEDVSPWATIKSRAPAHPH
jgi:hypothetical protein